MNAFGYLLLTLSLMTMITESKQQSQSSDTNKDIQSSINDLEGKLKKEPNSAFLHNQIAMLWNAAGNFAKFEEEIHKAIALEPRDPINYSAAAEVYGSRQRYNDQKQMLLEALRHDPCNPLLRYELGARYEREGRSEAATRQFKRAQAAMRAARFKDHGSDDCFRAPSRIEGNTYYDRFNNAFSIDHLDDLLREANKRSSKAREETSSKSH